MRRVFVINSLSIHALLFNDQRALRTRLTTADGRWREWRELRDCKCCALKFLSLRNFAARKVDKNDGRRQLAVNKGNA